MLTSHLPAMSVRVALLAAAPWVVTPLVTMIRARQSRSLDDESDVPPVDGPFVSIVIPHGTRSTTSFAAFARRSRPRIRGSR